MEKLIEMNVVYVMVVVNQRVSVIAMVIVMIVIMFAVVKLVQIFVVFVMEKVLYLLTATVTMTK